MRKTLSLFATISLFILLASCSGLFPAGGDATIVLQLGGSSSRALSDAPFAQLPVLSSYRITVSGPGMEPVSYTIPGNAPSFSASIPAGPERTIELYAPVDWAATAIALPGLSATFPTLVKAYGASSTLNLSAGKTVNVALRLGVVETKILLPDAINIYALAIADSLHPDSAPITTSFPISYNSDYEFDRYGRLVFNASSVYFVTNESVATPVAIPGLFGSNLAYSAKSDRLYVWYDDDGSNLSAYDFSSETPSVISVNEPAGYNFSVGSVAVDQNGYVYVPLQDSDTFTEGIAKLSIASPSGGFSDSSVLAFSPLSGLGLDAPLGIRDMTIKDNALYVIAGENSFLSTPHHGKLVEIELATLTKLRELGWASGNYPSSPSQQFYGPQRFIALAPRKLLIADEGFDGVSDIDRVVEVDIAQWAFSDLSAGGISAFFNSYSC